MGGTGVRPEMIFFVVVLAFCWYRFVVDVLTMLGSKIDKQYKKNALRFDTFSHWVLEAMFNDFVSILRSPSNPKIVFSYGRGCIFGNIAFSVHWSFRV